MRTRDRFRWTIPCWFAAVLTATPGCNPSSINSLVDSIYPAAPGDVPMILVRIENNSSADINAANIIVDTGLAEPKTVSFPVARGTGNAGTLFQCPVLRVALGDLDLGVAPAMTATFSDGTQVEVPFGMRTLVEGVDYVCGDTIIFQLIDDRTAETGLRIEAGRVDGSTQTGPFTGADTFRYVQLLLLLQTAGGTTDTTGTTGTAPIP